jgi:hypothetical protein
MSEALADHFQSGQSLEICSLHELHESTRMIGADSCYSWIVYASRFTRAGDTLTVERGIAIGWVCAAASFGATFRNLAD